MGGAESHGMGKGVDIPFSENSIIGDNFFLGTGILRRLLTPPTPTAERSLFLRTEGEPLLQPDEAFLELYCEIFANDPTMLWQ